MKPWWQVAIPHRDIREGRFDPSVFAIDLGEVVYGQGVHEYSDPVRFFTRTYMTNGLKELILKVLTTLYKEEVKTELKQISPVMQLVTPFGGGKTHSLLALYHITKNYHELRFMDEVKALLESIGLKEIPETNVASIDGTHLDPLKGSVKPEGMNIKTLWGELAYQLGGAELYGTVKEHDEKMVSPGKERIKEILKTASPCLLILDELLAYVLKARGVQVHRTNLGGQTMAFMQELTGAVAALAEDKEHSSVLVITLPSSHLERYDENAEKDYQTLKKITARIELKHSPVEGLEIYEIIRTRLFDEINDVDELKKVSYEFFKKFQELGESIPKEFRDLKYKERIERAYPFHPELIDVLYEKWGSLPGFQRTRGVLRLLALIVSNLYHKNDPNPIIMPGNIDLGNRLVQDEFLTYLEVGFSGVIDSDIAGPNAKSALIDRELPSEFEKHQIATRIATTIFLHSISKGGVLGISRGRIKATTITPDLSSPVINEALERMRSAVTGLWFLYSDEKGENFFFKKEPGLGMIITEKKEQFDDEEVLGFVHSSTATIAGEGNVYVAPDDPAKIPDTDAIKYVFVPIEHPYGENEKEETEKFCRRLLDEYLPATPRRKKNTMIFILPDAERIGGILAAGRELLALREIDGSLEIKENLSTAQKKDLQSKLNDARSKFFNELLLAYNYILVPSEAGFEKYELGLNVLRAKGDLKEFVERYLKENEILLDDIEPSILVSKLWTGDKDYLTTNDVYEPFLRYTSLEMITGKDVIRRAIAKGVSTGVFGYGLADYPEQIKEIKFKEDTRENEVELSDNAWLINAGIAEKLKSETKYEKPESGEGKSKECGFGFEIDFGIGKRKEEIVHRKVIIDIDASDARIVDIYKGIIKPLKDEAENVSVRINIEAEGDLSEHLLKMKVKETLQQLKSKYSFEEVPASSKSNDSEG